MLRLVYLIVLNIYGRITVKTEKIKNESYAPTDTQKEGVSKDIHTISNMIKLDNRTNPFNLKLIKVLCWKLTLLA